MGILTRFVTQVVDTLTSRPHVSPGPGLRSPCCFAVTLVVVGTGAVYTVPFGHSTTVRDGPGYLRARTSGGVSYLRSGTPMSMTGGMCHVFTETVMLAIIAAVPTTIAAWALRHKARVPVGESSGSPPGGSDRSRRELVKR